MFCLLVIGCFAVYFARERTYADAGYFLVRVIDEEWFHVINHRWLMPLIQWLPLVGVKLGLELSALVVLYSLGNVVIAGLAYWFTAVHLRAREHALLVLATQFVGLSHALFCPVFELYYGAMLLIVLHALLHHPRSHTPKGRILATALFVLVASCHFLGLLVLLFTLVLERIWERRDLLVLFLLALAAVMSHRVLAMSTYEQGAFAIVFHNVEHWGLLWTLAPGRLWGHFVQALLHYPDLFLLATLCVVRSMRVRAWYPLAVYAGGLCTIYFLVSLYFPDGTHERYRETLDYTPTVWTLVFCGTMLRDDLRWQRWAPRMLLCILLLRTAWATCIGDTFVARIEWMEERLAYARSMGIGKGLDPERPRFIPPGFNNAPLQIPAPFEYLLLSSMHGPAGTLVLVSFTDPSPTAQEVLAMEAYMGREGIRLPTRTNSRYFRMPTGPFVMLGPSAASSPRAPLRSEADRTGTRPQGISAWPADPPAR